MSDVVSLHKQASPTELEDLPAEIRAEILLRVPPQPRSLLRVSQVCHPWRRLVADPNFLRRFRARRADRPPLLGVFHNNCYEGAQRFTPSGEDPASERAFNCPAHWRVLDCRHGRVLVHAAARGAPPVLVLWDPLTRRCQQIQMPPEWMVGDYVEPPISGAVVCMAGEDAEGRHGDCRSSPFLVALLTGRDPRALVSVYSSETRNWSEVISFDGLPMWADVVAKPCVVIRNTLYQPVSGSHTLSFNVESKSFAMIPHPPETRWMDVQIMRLDDGGRLGLVVADNVGFSLRLWARDEDAGDWVLRWMVKLDTLKPLWAGAKPGTGNLRDM